MSEANKAIKELLFKMADDAMILGHRNSEWTGIGPTLEEDIAFSSMAQDKIGHAFQLYTILNEQLGEAEPDYLGFKRTEKEFKCCHLVELPTTDYAVSLVRHFLFDFAEELRYTALQESSFEPLAQLSKKIKGEIKYHTMHADVWVRLLGKGNEESKARLQSALNELWPFALGVFEPSDHEEQLIAEGIFVGEQKIKEQWAVNVQAIIEKAGLTVPDIADDKAQLGGRKAYHTEYLQPLLEEMTEVMRMDVEAKW